MEKRVLFVANEWQGLGIALVAALKAQVPVTLVDNSQASLEKGLKFAGEYTLSSFRPRLIE
jgi:3-hydroxybutyryl-CoA dehydrogenase